MMLAEETRIESARLRELRLGDDLVDAAVDVLAARGTGDGAVEPELHARLRRVRRGYVTCLRRVSQCVARSAIASARASTRRASSTCRFSIRRPSSTATPRPRARASAWAAITRRAQSTSPAAGAKTSFAVATRLGWVHVLPSDPKAAA